MQKNCEIEAIKKKNYKAMLGVQSTRIIIDMILQLLLYIKYSNTCKRQGK